MDWLNQTFQILEAFFKIVQLITNGLPVLRSLVEQLVLLALTLLGLIYLIKHHP
jgi:hypothetical protein